MSMITVTWCKSAIGYKQDQKDTIRRLGFKRLNQTIEVEDSPTMRGMIHKVIHLVQVEDSVQGGSEA